MLITVVNPNTTASMTATIGACARAVAGPGVRVVAVNPDQGPAAVESHYDDALATPGVLDAVVAAERDGSDGYVIACFGDPGLLAARELVTGPVVGIAEAAMRTAGYLGRRFSVITTLPRVIGHTWEIAERYGVARLCAGVHACELPVLALDGDPAVLDRIAEEASAALANDRSDVIVLGCAGMADLAAALTTRLSVPVVEGVAAATLQVETLVRLDLRTSKIGELAALPHRLDGELAGNLRPC